MPQAPPSSPAGPLGQLHRRALRPTVRRLRDLAERLPEAIRPLIETIAERFFIPGYLMFQIRREAGSTDWQVTLLAREIGGFIPPDNYV